MPGGARASSQILVDLPNPDLPEITPRGDRIDERTDLELLLPAITPTRGSSGNSATA